MLSTLRRLAPLMFGYGVSSLLGPFLALFLTPLYIRALDPGDYGTLEVALTLSSLIGSVCLLSTDMAIAERYFRLDETSRRNLIGTALVLVATAGTIAATVLATLSVPLAQALLGDASRSNTLRVLSVNLICAPIYLLCLGVLRLRMGVRRVNLLSLTYFATFASLNVSFVLVLGLRVDGVVAAMTFANVAGAIAGILVCRGPLIGRFDRNQVIPLLSSGLKMLPITFGLMLITNIDRLMLTQYVTLPELGLYGVANKLASIVTIVQSLGVAAWMPIALQMADRPEAQTQFAKVYDLFLVASSLFSLGFGLFVGDLLMLLGRPQYLPASDYAVVLIAYTGPILMSASMFSIALYAGQKTRYLSFCYAIAAPLNVFLNFVSNKTFGVWGAVWSTVATGLVLAIMTYAMAQRVYRVNYRWRTNLMYFATFAFALCASAFIDGPSMDSVLLRLLLIILLAASTIVYGLLRFDHLLYALGLFRARLDRQGIDKKS